ncbi:MAG TPA: hypothetical protein VM925_34580 [Labilithrix sp.]|jgi:hypothetical protein|nr:hypothetical protein [Labilithrix sp.]
MRRPFSTTGSIGSAKSRSIRRWPLVVASGPEERTFHLRATLVAIGVALLLTAPFIPNVSVTLRLSAGVIALFILGFAATRRRRPRPIAESYVVADASGLSRSSAGAEATPIVAWDAPFGVTLLASYGRPQGLLAFTTPTQTRYVPARVDTREVADDELFARIAVLADLDLVDGVTHDAALTSSDAAALIRHAEAHDHRALGRVYLSDGRGAPISLDRATLSIASRSFDLTSHLEWRALMFHESTGQAAALYQATWIRQNGAEVVLVAPMPASVVPREPNAHREATGRLGRTLTRDLRLLQSPAEPPPSRDVRVAIDRPFMMLVRRVLDEAPLASRVVLPAQKGPPVRGRDSMA